VEDFPHIAVNFLWPLNLTKYAVFVASNRSYSPVAGPHILKKPCMVS